MDRALGDRMATAYGPGMTDESWKITILGPRAQIQAALVAHEDAADWDPDVVLSGSELADDQPEDWRLEVYFGREPDAADHAAIAALFAGETPAMATEKLPASDWVTLSQQGLEPIRAGRFHIHTPDHPPLGEPGVWDFCIPASQAFGTGQHATTAGCLEMLSLMKSHGVVVRNLADIGTGTGLLAFAALQLWPRALATASDIDAGCIAVVLRNMALNDVPFGGAPGQLTMLEAPGLAHPLLQARAPYDLLIANILAGPLIALAPAFADALVPGGQLLLAGLLETQEPAIRTAYRQAGLRLAARRVKGDWSILWLRKRRRYTP
jgi:ribosomal protein L11 methyltransferase